MKFDIELSWNGDFAPELTVVNRPALGKMEFAFTVRPKEPPMDMFSSLRNWILIDELRPTGMPEAEHYPDVAFNRDLMRATRRLMSTPEWAALRSARVATRPVIHLRWLRLLNFVKIKQGHIYDVCLGEMPVATLELCGPQRWLVKAGHRLLWPLEAYEWASLPEAQRAIAAWVKQSASLPPQRKRKVS